MAWITTAIVLAVMLGSVCAVAAESVELTQAQAKFDPPPAKGAAAAQKPGSAQKPVPAPKPASAQKQPSPAQKPAAQKPAPAPPNGKRIDPVTTGATRPGGRQRCLTQSDTRETVTSRKLSPPFSALRTAGSHARGETIGVRLCRHNDDFFYEVNVLRRDGRVVKVIIDAPSGKILRSMNDH